MTLEELLNILLERGWKPFGNKYTSVCVLDEGNIILRFAIRLSGPDNKSCLETMRTITAKESGLWQFVCRNKLYPKNRGHKWEHDLGNGEIYYEDERQYYVIESALCDESEIEQCLLNNIKIDD